MGPADPIRTIEAVWRIESAKVIATVARMTGDVGLAEESAQDAFVLALESWPDEGVPQNPGGWLTTTAKRKAIDQLRRQGVYEEKLRELAQQPPVGAEPELLTLIFTACHPEVAVEGQLALTLRLLGGLTTAEIARAFLVPGADGRAADLPGQDGAAEGPGRASARRGAARAAGLGPGGHLPDLQRGLLGDGRRVVDPQRPVLRGAAAVPRAGRADARLVRGAGSPGAAGDPVVPAGRPRRPRRGSRSCSPTRTARRWDRLLIRRGLEALARAESTGGSWSVRPPGRHRGRPRPGPRLRRHR